MTTMLIGTGIGDCEVWNALCADLRDEGWRPRLNVVAYSLMEPPASPPTESEGGAA